MSLKLITLNVEGHRHLNKWLPAIKQEQPDVLCLQEVFEVDLPRIEEELGLQMKFVPKINVNQKTKYGLQALGNNGLAVGVNAEQATVISFETKVFAGNLGEVPVFKQPNSGIRAVLVTEVEKDGHHFIIGNTHFTWSKGGEISDLQKKDFAELKKIIKSYPELILCGDFNAPRGKEMFTMFEELLTDNLPKDIKTTIDGNLHYAGNLQLVVDTIFSTSQYEVNNIRTISGVSDHLAVTAQVIKK